MGKQRQTSSVSFVNLLKWEVEKMVIKENGKWPEVFVRSILYCTFKPLLSAPAERGRALQSSL